MIKAVMLYFGNNMMASESHLYPDFLEKTRGNRKAQRHAIAETKFLFDYPLWVAATDLMHRGKLNTVLVELNEGVVYPSHPELAVEGSWEPTRLQDELKRLRKLGLNPIPKLNFSTSHCAWQKGWRRLTSTPEYYKFCSEIIGDVCEIFEHPSHFHIGMDEEWATSQEFDPLVILRQGSAWIHDCRYLIHEVEKHNAQCVMWADWLRTHPDICVKHIPKNVLVQNWYYAELFNPAEFPPPPWSGIGYHAYQKLEELGYDQCPTGSNWCGPRNMGLTVRHCLKTIAPKRLKGFMIAPWKRTLPENRDVILGNIQNLIGSLEAAGI